MKVFKFGGASIKDVSSIKNILKIISSYNDEKLVIVVSAMGKTTNALEIVVHNYFSNKTELQSSILDLVLLSSFYLIRILSGGIATETIISFWLLLA